MANPMQRRAKNSFILGVLLGLVIVVLVAGFFIMQIRKVNEELDAIKAKQVTVYVASRDLDSGTDLTSEDLISEQVQTTMNPANAIDQSIFWATGENEEETEAVVYKTKISIPAGSIITTDMIYDASEEISDSERIQEFNMIILPSHLKNGDYIDIRFGLPSGEDYIVLTKKRVEGTTASTIWLKLSEEEILTLNNAILEAWKITGSKLYALQYTDPGLQKEATSTYPVSREVLTQIEKNPNIVNEAKQALFNRYDDSLVNQRNNVLSTALSKDANGSDGAVESGISELVSEMQELRKDYITELEGTDAVGYSEE